MEQSERGRVILLNGASSSGKSTLGRELQRILPEPWFLFGVDALGAMRSRGAAEGEACDERLAALLRRTRLGYHRAVGALASAGNDVIMDYPLSEPWRLQDLLEVLEPYEVTLVDVHCEVAELERRERTRGDREAGLARSQRVFEHADCDIAVDSFRESVHACAEAIADAVAVPRASGAFERLRTARK